MGQHYLPKYYLKGFASAADPPLLWVYEKGTERKFRTSTTQVANENRYWSDEFESWLARNIEGPANPVLQKIRQREKLTQDDKTVLSTYIVSMIRRVPKGKAWTRRWLTDAKNTDPIFHRLIADLEQQKHNLPDLRDKVERAVAQAKVAQNDPSSVLNVGDIWEKSLRPDLSAGSIAALDTMAWGFLIRDEKPTFLTCDDPVFYFRDIGVGRPKSELSFPIDQHTVLWATRRSDWRTDYVRADKRQINEMNRRTAYSAVKYVFFSNNEDWIPRLVNRKVYKLPRYI